MYTSGTTGRPKGVMLDHQSLLAKNQAAAERMGLGPEDRLALFFPLHHMFGNCCVALTGLIRGATLVMPGYRFEPGAVLEAMAEEKCTALFGAPAMMSALLEHPSRREHDLSSLRTGIIGGAPCPLELLRRVVEELGAGEITIAYGITEAAGWIAMTEPHDPLEVRATTLGKPLKGCQVKVVDPDSGQELPPGQEGEVCTKGFLMKGYLQMEGLTAQVVDTEGWLHTGDQGSLDAEGRLRLSGRRKEMIRTAAGEVFPAEVEEAVYQLPQVSQAAAFGLPAPEGDHEVIALWVRLKPEAALSEDEILEHCRRELDPTRVPAVVRLVEELPTTPSGKIQRHRLRELAQS
jgi:fatty-acyl-CoA synthase